MIIGRSEVIITVVKMIIIQVPWNMTSCQLEVTDVSPKRGRIFLGLLYPEYRDSKLIAQTWKVFTHILIPEILNL